jgi:uncharacterized protein (DUF2384 family)
LLSEGGRRALPGLTLKGDTIVHRHDPDYVMELARRVFGDAAKATEWFNQPRLQLGGRTPMEVLSTEDGAQRVEELLAQIDDDKRLGIR